MLAADPVGNPGHFRQPDNPAAWLFSPAALSRAKAPCGDTVTHSLAGGRHAYLALAAGAVTVNGVRLQCGDGIAISGNSDIQIGALQRSELVLVDTA